MLGRMIGKVGTALPRRIRRLILDRLGGARAAAWLGGEAFETARLQDSVVLYIKPIIHGGVSRRGSIDHEANLAAIIKERVGEGAVFYDVGANIGVFTCLAALRVGPAGTVVAFEPEPNNLACLTRSIRHNRLPASVRLMEIAVTDKDGPVAFDRRGGAFSGRVVGGSGEDGPGGAVVEVPGRSIDALVRTGEIPAPDFVKIDVEGGEGPVVAGMTDTLADRRPEIILEMHHFAASSVAQAYAILDSNGYRFFRLDAYAGGLPPALAPNERKSARHILALPPTPARSA